MPFLSYIEKDCHFLDISKTLHYPWLRLSKECHFFDSGVTLYQGPPGSKFSKAPLVEVSKARVERRICTSFLGSPGHAHAKIFESRDSEMPSLGLWGEILRNSDGQKILMVRKRHCNISEASLADVFAL
jgi:hypothetical protein